MSEERYRLKKADMIAEQALESLAPTDGSSPRDSVKHNEVREYAYEKFVDVRKALMGDSEDRNPKVGDAGNERMKELEAVIATQERAIWKLTNELAATVPKLVELDYYREDHIAQCGAAEKQE